MSNIYNGDIYHDWVGSMEVEYETTPGLSIGIVTFDLEWHLTVLDLSHKTCTSNISNTVKGTMLDTMEVI